MTTATGQTPGTAGVSGRAPWTLVLQAALVLVVVTLAFMGATEKALAAAVLRRGPTRAGGAPARAGGEGPRGRPAGPGSAAGIWIPFARIPNRKHSSVSGRSSWPLVAGARTIR